MCAGCQLSKQYKPGRWFGHIWNLFRLQRGGFPFEADDLTLQEWTDIGVLKDEFELWLTRSR